MLLHHQLLEQMERIAPPPGGLAIWGLGQMGVALKGDDRIVYIDPVLTDVVNIKVPDTSGRFDRAFGPPLLPEEVHNAAYVLTTHEHLDHTDPLTLGPLAKASPQAHFIASDWARDALREAGIPESRCTTPTLDAPLELDGIRVWAVPAAHYEVETDPGRGSRWLSYLIEWNGVGFFHSGDTLLYPGYLERIKELPQAQVALVAANGRDAYRESFDVLGNLMPAEAAWMAQQLGWDVLLAGHNDLFTWNALPPGMLQAEIYKVNPRQKFHILQPGELYLYTL